MFTETQVAKIDEIVNHTYERGMVQAFRIALGLQVELGAEAVEKILYALESGGIERMLDHVDNMMALYSDDAGKRNTYWLIKSNIKSVMGI